VFKNYQQTDLCIEDLITNYHQKNAAQLKDPFWTRLFHRTVIPTNDTTKAYNAYIAGCVKADKKEYAAAIEGMKKAVELKPDQNIWRLTLALTRRQYAESLIAKAEAEPKDETKKDLLKKAHDLLFEALMTPHIDAFGGVEGSDLAMQVSLRILALRIKLGMIPEAVQFYLERPPMFGPEEGMPYNFFLFGGRCDILTSYPGLIKQSPIFHPGHENLKKFCEGWENTNKQPDRLKSFEEKLNVNKPSDD
jgi:hypothetical protein